MHFHRCTIHARGCHGLIPCTDVGCNPDSPGVCRPCESHRGHPHMLGECITYADAERISKDGP